jgi:uncharacterized lipoprotein NlpE involved in copper resistance
MTVPDAAVVASANAMRTTADSHTTVRTAHSHTATRTAHSHAATRTANRHLRYIRRRGEPVRIKWNGVGPLKA